MGWYNSKLWTIMLIICLMNVLDQIKLYKCYKVFGEFKRCEKIDEECDIPSYEFSVDELW